MTANGATGPFRVMLRRFVLVARLATVFAIITDGVEPAKEVGAGPPSQTIVLSDIPWTEGPVPGTRHKAFWSDPITKRRR